MRHISASPRCQAQRANKQPCRAFAQHESAFCFQHDPARAADAAAARSEGGKATATPAPAPPCDLSTPEARRRLLELTVDRVRAGDESAKVAQVVINACNAVERMPDDAARAQRLKELEQMMAMLIEENARLRQQARIGDSE